MSHLLGVSVHVPAAAAPGPFHWKTLPVLVGPHDNRWDRLSAVMSQRGHFPVIESGERRIECWGKLWHKLVRVLCLRALVNIKHTLVTWLGHDSNPSHPQSKTHFKVSYKIYSLQVQKCFSCLLMVLYHRWDQVQTWVLWWHQRVCVSHLWVRIRSRCMSRLLSKTQTLSISTLYLTFQQFESLATVHYQTLYIFLNPWLQWKLAVFWGQSRAFPLLDRIICLSERSRTHITGN